MSQPYSFTLISFETRSSPDLVSGWVAWENGSINEFTPTPSMLELRRELMPPAGDVVIKRHGPVFTLNGDRTFELPLAAPRDTQVIQLCDLVEALGAG